MLIATCPVQGQHRGRPVAYMFTCAGIRAKQPEQSWAPTGAKSPWVSTARPGYVWLSSLTKSSMFQLNTVTLLQLYDFWAEAGFILLFLGCRERSCGLAAPVHVDMAQQEQVFLPSWRNLWNEFVTCFTRVRQLSDAFLNQQAPLALRRQATAH